MSFVVVILMEKSSKKLKEILEKSLGENNGSLLIDRADGVNNRRNVDCCRRSLARGVAQIQRQQFDRVIVMRVNAYFSQIEKKIQRA